MSEVKRTEVGQPHAERTTGKTKRVLVIGKGGREHALCWALSRSPRVERVFCAPGNAGTAQLGRNVALEPSDFKGLARFARHEEIDLVVIGPEEPLCQGLADHLRDQGLKVFGPSAEAAELEGSKLFAKDLMKQAGIPTAEAKVFDNAKDAETYVLSREVMLTIRPRNHHSIRQASSCRTAADCLEMINAVFDPRDYPNPALEVEIIGRNQKQVFRKGPEAREFVLRQPLGLVVKADGLAAGKGVEVCDDFRSALDAIQRIMVRREFGKAGDKILIEERLEGPEASVLALTDGRTIAPFDIAQDFKRAFDNDEGPNTGGMGAYSPTTKLITPEVMARIEEQVLVPAVHFMKKRRRPFQGVLYAGLILTEQGPKVLEFNVRFGDPECQVLLPRLKSDLYDLLEAVVEERLEEVELQWDTRASVCVTLVSEGYPGPFEKDKAISGLEEAARLPDVLVFHAGTKTNHEGRVLTDGGRVLNVVGLGDTLAQARDRAYQAAALIRFQGRRYRSDIALHAVEHG